VQSIQYCGNITDNLGIGLLFEGDCSLSDITQNEINYHNIGMYVEDTGSSIPGEIGVQSGKLNVWLEDSNPNHPVYFLNAARYTSSKDVINSRYLVKNEDASNIRYKPTNIYPPNNWFIPMSIEHELCLEVEPTPFI